MTSEAAYHEMYVSPFLNRLLSLKDVFGYDRALAQRAHKAYEFPDGFNTVFGTEKYRAVEGMFAPGKFYVPVSIFLLPLLSPK